MILNFKQTTLEENGGIHTLTEIVQQPQIWKEVLTMIQNQQEQIKTFLAKEVDLNTKIIFTGAGTSEFVGSTIYPYLIAKGYDVVSIPTTDLVTNINEFVNPNQKTLLVSFARSGNSPESVATFEMMSNYVKDLKHLVITCNATGQLALKAQQDSSNFVLVLPEAANDQSFAMTSSFTGMMLTAVLFFMINDLPNLQKKVNQIANLTEQLMSKNYAQLSDIANLNHERIVFLGSGVFKGLAQEAQLKVLELSAGKVNTFFNTPVGFRHGPKSILNHQTIVFFFLNAEPYARKYDLDLLTELWTQQQLDQIVVIDSLNDPRVKAQCNVYFSTNSQIDDNFINALSYITFAQLYAFSKSLSLQNRPDNPWPSGLVNRVVQGVIIHSLSEVN